MTCPLSQQISTYYDGELAEPALAEFQGHLSQCAACQAELAMLKRLSTAVRAAPRTQPSEQMISRWIARSPRAADDRQVRRLAQWLTAAAAMVLVTCLLSLNQHDTAAQQPLSEVDSLMLSPMAMRSDEPASPSMVTARWLAADLDLGSTSGDRP